MSEPATLEGMRRSLAYLMASLSPTCDKEAAATMLLSILHEQHQRGIRDAVEICDRALSMRPHSMELNVVRSGLHELLHLNERDHQRDGYTWAG